MPWLAVPAFGAVAGVVKAKEPGVDAVPRVRAELASVWPNMIAEAIGAAEIVGVALFTVTLIVVVAVL